MKATISTLNVLGIENTKHHMTLTFTRIWTHAYICASFKRLHMIKVA